MMFVKTQDGRRLVGLQNVQEIRFYKAINGRYALIVDAAQKDYELGEYKTEEDAKYALEQIAKQIKAAEVPESDTCYTDAIALDECKNYWITQEMAETISSVYGVKTLGELADKIVYAGKGWDDFPKLTKEVAITVNSLLMRSNYLTTEEYKQYLEDIESPENASFWKEREAQSWHDVANEVQK